MANNSVSSTLSRASTLVPFDVTSQNAGVKVENAVRSALGDKPPQFMRRTPEGLKFNACYLTIAHRAAQELEIKPQLLRQKPWWQKVMRIVNEEIGNLEVTYSSLEFRIDYALRETVSGYTIFTTADNPETVIDYTAIYRAVEQQLDLPSKFLNQKKWKTKRTEIVNDQVKQLNATNSIPIPTPILVAGTVSPQKGPFLTIPFPFHTNIGANSNNNTSSNASTSTESLTNIESTTNISIDNNTMFLPQSATEARAPKWVGDWCWPWGRPWGPEPGHYSILSWTTVIALPGGTVLC